MGQVYREFSRQKYQKYKHQFPQLRESELVGRIIKEWDSLDAIAKEQLRAHYESKKYLTPGEISSSESEMRERLAQKAKEAKSKGKSTSAILDVSQPFSKSSSRPKKRSDSGARASDRKDDSKQPYDSSSPLVAKRKLINRTKQDYVSFYKKMTTFLSHEHPRWTQAQISSIVRLEWRKKKSSAKKIAKKALRKSHKVVSGYQFFRRHRKFSSQEAKDLWKHFPHETKVSWTHKSADVEQEPANQVRRKVVFKGEPDTPDHFSYLHSSMH